MSQTVYVNFKLTKIKVVCSYRIPLLVTQIKEYPDSMLSFSVCPKCRSTLEREYQSYCDRCGQCLDWSEFSDAEIIVWKENNNG